MRLSLPSRPAAGDCLDPDVLRLQRAHIDRAARRPAMENRKSDGTITGPDSLTHQLDTAPAFPAIPTAGLCET